MIVPVYTIPLVCHGPWGLRKDRTQSGGAQPLEKGLTPSSGDP